MTSRALSVGHICHSLRCGQNAPPSASQAYAPGVASQTATCFNHLGPAGIRLEAIPLNIFLLPFFWGTQKRGRCSQSERLHFGRGHKKSSVGFQKICWEETEKQKARRCRAQEFGPSSAQENALQEKAGLPNCEDRAFMSCARGQLKRNTKGSAVARHRSEFDDGARFERPLRWRAPNCLADALGQRGSCGQRRYAIEEAARC